MNDQTDNGGQKPTCLCRMFPIMYPRPGDPRGVPWPEVARREYQAKLNHGDQSLETLARRGGLDLFEMAAVLLGVGWRHFFKLHGWPYNLMQAMTNEQLDVCRVIVCTDIDIHRCPVTAAP